MARILLCCFLLLFGCSRAPEVANLDSKGTRIVCFGDSLTAGEGAEAGEDYPSRLQAALPQYPIVNAGVSGDTTGEALGRLEPDVLEQDPLLVIVILGGNDFLKRLPSAQTFQNLETIIRRVQGRGAIVVLASVQGGLFGDIFRKEYQALARKYRTAFVPHILEGILSNPSFKSDTIHPNAAGYQKMADRILKIVGPLLEENRHRRLR